MCVCAGVCACVSVLECVLVCVRAGVCAFVCPCWSVCLCVSVLECVRVCVRACMLFDIEYCDNLGEFIVYFCLPILLFETCKVRLHFVKTMSPMFTFSNNNSFSLVSVIFSFRTHFHHDTVDFSFFIF